MKKTFTTFAIAIAVAIAALAAFQFNQQVTPGVQAAAPFFGDACKNVKFKVKNQHNSGGQIEIRQVEYFNKANGKWQVEDIPNQVINQGATFTTNGDDLKDSEGEQITKIKYRYKYKPTGAGANWSDEIVSNEFVPSSPVCNAGRTYGTFTLVR
jgi:hypothetical protein